jgi:hypothetical protein
VARRFTYRRVKIHRNHPVAELADVIGARKQTIGRWIAAGLPTTDRKRRYLIRGVDIHAFMQERRLERDLVSLDWFGGRARKDTLTLL